MNAWLCPPTLDQLDRLGAAQRAFAREQAQHVVLSLVDPRVGKVMEQDARERAKQLSAELLPYTLGHCYVVLGSGFFAAMARSVITGIQLVGGSSKPWKVAGEIHVAYAWTASEAEKAGLRVAPADLEATAATLIAGA